MQLLLSGKFIFGVVFVTVGAVVGAAIYGHGLLAGVVALYAIGFALLMRDRAIGRYVAFGSDAFYEFVASPATVPMRGITALVDVWDRFTYERQQKAEQAKAAKASEHTRD